MENLPILVNLGPFNPNKDSWEVFNEKLEFFFSANKINDVTRKRDALINFLDSSVYKLIRDLCSPALPKDKKYDEICEILNKHYSPQVSIFRERQHFFGADQKQDESINDYCARLRGLAVSCKFGDHLEHNLLNKFITGALPRYKKKLFEEDEKLTLGDAVKKANAVEIMQQQDQVGVNYVNRRVREGNENKNYHEFNKRQNGDSKMASSGNNNNIKSSGNDFKTKNVSSNKNCTRCNKTNHLESDCIFKKLNCYKCKKLGHSSRVCNNKISRNCFLENNDKGSSEIENDDMYAGIYNLFNVNSKTDNPIMLNVKMDNKEMCMQLDTGAAMSVISKDYFIKKFSNLALIHDDTVLQSYSGEILKVMGAVQVVVTYKHISDQITLLVVDSGGPPILGRDFMRKFNISFNINKIEINELGYILDKYASVFEPGLGLFKLIKVKLEVDNPKPIFFKPRAVPFSLKASVEQEIMGLENKGVLTKIKTSDYGTPLVPVLKDDGTIRICGDYKVTVNKFLKSFNHPLPRIEDILYSLGNGEKFTKLDLSCAYNQLELDDESKKYVTWSTHMGIYQMNRLPYGIKPASGIFQLTMEKLFQGIPKVVVFIDDIVVTGSNDEEHLKNLNLVLDRIKTAGLKLNKRKCKFFQNEISYLGYRVTKDGLYKTKERVEAILNIKPPRDVTETRSLCGLINYYSKFIKNVAMIMHPIYQLLKQDEKFVWSDKCDRALNKIKNEMTSDRFLAHFNPELQIILTCDASQYGIGAVLSHKYPNGDERPVAFISRTLSEAESNYSMQHKEALAIIFALNKLYQYLIGNKFIIRTDHKSLITALGEQRGLPQIAAARLQRWAHFLSGFDYMIEYVKGKENMADIFSRHPLKANEEVFKEYEDKASYLNYFNNNKNLVLDYKLVQQETKKDSMLSKVLDMVRNGHIYKDDNPEYKAFVKIKNELSVEQDVVLRGYKVVIPKSLRGLVLKELHKPHFGIVKTKSMARSYVWWPKIDGEIEEMIHNCRACLQVQPNPPKAELISWEIPDRPWSRIHLDYAGPWQNTNFLIIIDAYSKWIEIFKMRTTTAEVTKMVLGNVFSRFGLPDVIVTDNGSQFCAEIMREYFKLNGIRHILTAPGHPATNGAAENMVKTLKKSMKAVFEENKKSTSSFDIDSTLQTFLLNYRTTRHSTTNETPAKLMFNRELKMPLHLLKPPKLDDRIKMKQEIAKANYKGKRTKSYEPREEVLVKDYSDPNKSQWMDAVIWRRIGPRTYLCKLNNNRRIKRHLNQIRDGVRKNESSIENLNENSKKEDRSNHSNKNEGSYMYLNNNETQDRGNHGNQTINNDINDFISVNRPRREIKIPIRYQD